LLKSIIVVLCLSLGSLTSLAESSPASNVEPMPPLVVSCDNWPNYCNADASGLYLDIIREVFQLEDINISLLMQLFKHGLFSVKNNEVDAMAGVVKSTRREFNYYFPKTRLGSVFVGLLHRKNTHFTDLHSVTGSVAKVRGYYDGTKYITGGMKVHEVTDHQEGIKLLNRGRVDYFLDAHVTTYQAIKDLNLSPSDYRFELIGINAEYLIFPKTKKGKNLAEIYDKNFFLLHESGRLQELFAKTPMFIPYFYYPEVSDNGVSLPLLELPLTGASN